MEIHLLFSELESGVSTHETRESIYITQQNANIWREKHIDSTSSTHIREPGAPLGSIVAGVLQFINRSKPQKKTVLRT